MLKRVKQPGYNYVFDSKTGDFARWGIDYKDDPDFSPVGPEIADIEVTTKCKGPGGHLCKFCYKGNKPQGDNMSFETFKEVFAKLPSNLTQIAFGADADLSSNPDVWKMFDHCRENNIVPNITVADVDKETAERLASVCGAVAVSRYKNKHLCYNSIRRLLDAGMTQVNIHMMVSKETFKMAMDTIRDYHTDSRLKGMNAIVFLSLKPKNRGERFHRCSEKDFQRLTEQALETNTSIGFDSCSANKFIRATGGDKSKFHNFAEPCESTCFSSYIDVHGKFFPCSFTPGLNGWDEGLDVPSCNSFMEDIWNHPKTVGFREGLIGNPDENGLRTCPLYEV